MDTLVVISDKTLINDTLASHLPVKRIYQVSSSVEYLPILSGQLNPDLLIADMDSPLSRELISLSCCALAQQDDCRCFFISNHPERFDANLVRSLTGRWLSHKQLEMLPELLGSSGRSREKGCSNAGDFAGLRAAAL